ncbi:hypothetical protein DPMN_111121 [Dreissena polymorpha]|uniref:Uncharacterized protein n=1 Tax=Dreissena polymorpha TaxID=45954 RepID=A0A9D4QPK5_DREPO|nr:hypothetical protein DPMN_111121 [Dreissena polymorpha]
MKPYKDKCPAPWWPCFSSNWNHFRTCHRYHWDKYSDQFHDDRTINVASRVLTRKNATTPWRPCIIRTNCLSKFHDDRAINVASRVLIRKNAPLPSGHFFKATKTIFELIQDIIGKNLLTKFHEDRKINVASRVLTRKKCPAPWRPYIIGMNLLAKFHEDRTINVASREKCPTLGSHVFQANVNIFEVFQDIIETNLLTKFHEYWTINVASRVLTRQMLTAHDARRTTHDGQKAITKAHHEHVLLR